MEIRKEELRLGIREAYLSDLRGYAASRSDSKGIVSSSKTVFIREDEKRSGPWEVQNMSEGMVELEEDRQLLNPECAM